MTLAHLISTQKRAVLVCIALLCAAGIYAAWQLPTAIFPSTDFPRITIAVWTTGSCPRSRCFFPSRAR